MTGELKYFFMPPPTGGWNTRDPLVDMPAEDAQTLVNVFPDTDNCRLAGSTTAIADVTANANILTLGVLADTTSEKLWCVSSTSIYDASAGGAGTDITGAASVTAGVPWQYAVFKHKVIAVNGTDTPWTWAGSGNVAPVSGGAAWTGGPTLSTLINVSVYKGRFYLCRKDSAIMYYSTLVDQDPATAVALSSFDFGPWFTKGGTLVFTGSSTNQGETTQELFIAVSSQGEIVVYQGDYPGSSTWSIVARYFVAKPLIYRTGFYVGADLHLLTWQGIIPLSTLLANIDINNQYLTISGKVEKAFYQAAATQPDNRQWAAAYWPKGRYVCVNVPTGTTSSVQYVMNNITKAWTVFNPGLVTVYSLVVWNNELYIGGASGNIYKYDQVSGADGATVTFSMDGAYNLFAVPNKNKKATFIQPIIGVIYNAGTVTISQFTATDFDNSTGFASIILNCDTTEVINRQVFPTTALGKFIQERYQGTLQPNTQMKFYGNWFVYEEAGFIP